LRGADAAVTKLPESKGGSMRAMMLALAPLLANACAAAGRWYDRARLDALLAELERAAAASRQQPAQ
jgi:hypothetical protein